MRPLVLTGPPLVGMNTVGAVLAARRSRCALVDVSGLRHMVISGFVPPWVGAEGTRQSRLGVVNACALAENYARADIGVIILDALSDRTAQTYRQRLTGVRIVALTSSYDEAKRRAESRPISLSWQDLEMLHRQQQELTAYDHAVTTEGRSTEEISDLVEGHWLH